MMKHVRASATGVKLENWRATANWRLMPVAGWRARLDLVRLVRQKYLRLFRNSGLLGAITPALYRLGQTVPGGHGECDG